MTLKSVCLVDYKTFSVLLNDILKISTAMHNINDKYVQKKDNHMI